MLGVPAPQGSKRHVGNGRMIESSTKVKPWRAAVAAAFPVAPIDGPVEVVVTFVLPRPKSERKTYTRPHTRRPDLDKLIRSTLDALTGRAFGDDSQVTHIDIRKRTAHINEPSGAVIEVRPDSRQVDSGPTLFHR